MDITSIIIGLVLLALTAGVVILPFRDKEKKGGKNAAAANGPVRTREMVLLALRDLDFDFQTGKVNEADYTPVRARLLGEAAELLKQEQVEEARLEELITTRRGRKAAVHCQHCDTVVEPGQKFCSKCGAPIDAKLCSSCGNIVKEKDLFCTSCGNKVWTPVEAVSQA